LLPSFAGARLVGVGHIAITCAFKSGDFPRSTSVLAPSGVRIAFSASDAVGVGQNAAATGRGSWSILLRPSGLVVAMPAESFQSRALAVTHSAMSVGNEPQSIATVGRVDGTSRNNGSPAGVADAFQISMHSVEPILANRCCNLLTHEDSGPAGCDESKVVGP
jgi:hypothetical protein